MTSVLIAIAAMFAYGIPATLMLDPRARGGKLAAFGFLYGSGIVFLAMLILSIANVSWTVPLIATVAFLIACSFRVLRITVPPGDGDLRPRQTHSKAEIAVHALTALTVLSYASYATLAHLWEWDYWAIWGLKGRVFFENHGLDWRYLSSEWNTFAHNDYPQLLPFNFSFIALIGGTWDDRWLGLLNVMYAIAALLIVWALRRETTPLIGALATLACASTAASCYVGLAEGALIAFGAAGVLMIRAAIIDDDPLAMRHGALLLGFAASCKNEGVAMLVAVAIAVALVARKWLLRLWPSIVIAAPWMVLRAFHHLPTDLAEGNVAARVIAHLRTLHVTLLDLALSLYNPVLWCALLATIVLLPSSWRRRERFVLLVVGIQLAFYLASYLVTPHDVHWHIGTSWPRLTRHVHIPLIVVTVFGLANWLSGGEDAAHAEARSEV